MTAFGTFFVPGPTEVRRDVLEAMTQPMIPHRSAAFETIFARAQRGLQHVFRTQRPVYVSASSGSGMMEAAIRNAPVGPILCLVNGAFSERFANIARACDREVTVLEAAWGAVHDPGAVEQALSARWYAAMTATHSETSTGALSDIEALANLAHAHGAMVLVDSVSGLAGARLEADAWQLDFVLTGSQKAMALPPGLSFAVASEAYVLQAQTVTSRGRYFDVVEMEEYARKNNTPATPAVSLMYALDAQLPAIVAEGIEARWARHERMRAMTEAWAERGAGTGVFATAGSRSPTVSVITLPDGIAGDAAVRAIAERGVTVASGYGKLKDRTFRIGHMGDHSVDGLQRCLDACTSALASLGAA